MEGNSPRHIEKKKQQPPDQKEEKCFFFRRVGDRTGAHERGTCRINGNNSVIDRVVIINTGLRDVVLIIKPPRPGRRGSLELGRRESKLVSKLFGVVGRVRGRCTEEIHWEVAAFLTRMALTS